MKIYNLQIIVINEIISSSKYANPKSRRYSPEWLLSCLLLHIRHPATYNFLKEQSILPLPDKSTVRRYLRDSNFGCGFDDEFFLLFGKTLESNPDLARNGILSFDEMKVKCALDVNVKNMKYNGLRNFGNDFEEQTSDARNYFEKLSGNSENEQDDKSNTSKSSKSKSNLTDNLKNSETTNDLTNKQSQEQDKQNDSNISTDAQADTALVFMYSSLAHKVHQPIAMFASVGATPHHILALLMITAIIKLEKIGAKVHGIVCDGASTNRAMWEQLGINGKCGEEIKCSFPNPYFESRQVFFFSDVPHIFKCIRNNLYERKTFKV